LYFYQVKIVINEKNLDEFLDCLDSLSAAFRKEDGFLDYSFYLDVQKENTYCLVGEWKTHQDIEKHFKGKNFSVIIGASRVLAETFELSINETTEKGGFNLAKEKISMLRPKEQADL